MDPKSIAYEITQCYTEDQIVDSDIRQTINGYRRSRDLVRLSTCSSLFDPQKHGINEWRFLRQVESFFKKNSAYADRSVLKAAAYESFLDSERRCSEANDRIRDILLGVGELSPRPKHQMYLARRYISRVLGNFRSFDQLIPSLVRVTSGATTNSPRADSLPQLKLSLRPYCTSKSVGYVRRVYESFGFMHLRPRICDENRIELVPKDWRKDRTIACEPEGTLPLQLAFDSWAKRRLRRFGIDLRDQTRNQSLCKHASIYNHFVTVDFSSASDTVSYAAVAWLFPSEWFSFLDSIRCRYYRGVFGRGEYAKFSSMGNGATFTIETLIFSALCYACGSRFFLVYGDDVIIEKDFYADFIALAELLGFVINRSKSFSDGPVRESCGKEFFLGEDVTPVIVKGIDRRKASLCHLVNTVGRLTYPGERLREYLDRLIVDEKLPLIPYSGQTMEGVWIDPFVARQRGLLRYHRTSYGSYLLSYKAYVAVCTRRSFVDSRGYYLWFLYKNSQVLFSGPWGSVTIYDPLQTSSAPVFTHRYARRWVVWHLSYEGVPDYVQYVAGSIHPKKFR